MATPLYARVVPYPLSARRCRVALAATAVALAITGCGNGGEPAQPGAASPTAAVGRFLAVFDVLPVATRDGDRREVQKMWANACARVDPLIRPKLHFFDEGEVTPLVNCGAVVTAEVLYTGDTGDMLPPSRVSGTALSADTAANLSVVTVRMHYESDGRVGLAPAPPTDATLKVLAVRRAGSWWVATPAAFNPLNAVHGGLDEAALRRQHRDLLSDP